MVSFSQVERSNSFLSRSSLVAVFVGGTSGVGSSTAHSLARRSKSPTIFILGRTDRVTSSLREANPNGTYTFLSVDSSLLSDVHRVIKDELKPALYETGGLDLLVLSAGYLDFSGKRKDTNEGLDELMVLRYYARAQFILGLKDELKRAEGRVVSVLSAGKEGSIFPDDLGLEKPGNYGTLIAGGASATYTTLFLEELYKRERITGVHLAPGFVNTPLYTNNLGAVARFLLKVVIVLTKPLQLSVEEVGERTLFAGTSARYGGKGVMDTEEAITEDGGAFGLDWDGERKEGKVLVNYRSERLGKRIWDHTIFVLREVETKGVIGEA